MSFMSHNLKDNRVLISERNNGLCLIDIIQYGISFDIELCQLAITHQRAWAPHLFSSHCNEVIIILRQKSII